MKVGLVDLSTHAFNVNLPTYHTGMSSSAFMEPAFHFKILVTAEIAFSVGFMFSGSLELGACIISISLGIAVAQIDAYPGPPCLPITPHP